MTYKQKMYLKSLIPQFMKNWHNSYKRRQHRLKWRARGVFPYVVATHIMPRNIDHTPIKRWAKRRRNNGMMEAGFDNPDVHGNTLTYKFTSHRVYNSFMKIVNQCKSKPKKKLPGVSKTMISVKVKVHKSLMLETKNDQGKVFGRDFTPFTSYLMDSEYGVRGGNNSISHTILINENDMDDVDIEFDAVWKAINFVKHFDNLYLDKNPYNHLSISTRRI